MSDRMLKSAPHRDGFVQNWMDCARRFVFSERGRTVLSSVLLVLNVVLLVVFVLFKYKGYFHSDSSVRVLLAQEMHETGKFFPPGWNYVNKDLMVVFPHLAVWILQLFFGSGYALYAASGILAATLILASIWWFSGLLGGATWQRVLAVAIMAGGISAAVAEDMFGQAAYGVLVMLTCLITMLAWKSIVATSGRRLIWLALLLILVTLVSWSNPQRAAASYILPLFCGLAAFLRGAGWTQRLRASLPTVVVTLAGFALGSVLSALTLARVNNISGAGAARWLGFDAMVSNLVGTVHGLLGLLGGVPASGGDVLSVAGVYAALRLLAAPLLLVLVGRAIVKLCGSHADRARYVGGLVAGISMCFLFLQVTTTVPDMAEPVTAARYLTPMVVLGLMLLICSPLDRISSMGATTVVALGLLLASSSLVYLNPGSMVHARWDNPQRDALVDELEAMGLKYGYASYWNSGALTVLSKGKVSVRQINIYGGMPVPMRHLSADRWYEPEAWQGETFLLLEDKDVAALDWGSLTRYAGQPIRQAEIAGMKVFVFRENLSSVLPNWSGRLREPFRMSAAPDGAHVVGRWDGATRTLRAKQGESGFLQFGPYRPLNPGQYTAMFEVSGTSKPAEQVIAKVDVAVTNGSKVLGSTDVLGNGVVRHTVNFTVEQAVSDLEFRVWTTGSGEVTYTGMTLATAP